MFDPNTQITHTNVKYVLETDEFSNLYSFLDGYVAPAEGDFKQKFKNGTMDFLRLNSTLLWNDLFQEIAKIFPDWLKTTEAKTGAAFSEGVLKNTFHATNIWIDEASAAKVLFEVGKHLQAALNEIPPPQLRCFSYESYNLGVQDLREFLSQASTFQPTSEVFNNVENLREDFLKRIQNACMYYIQTDKEKLSRVAFDLHSFMEIDSDGIVSWNSNEQSYAVLFGDVGIKPYARPGTMLIECWTTIRTQVSCTNFVEQMQPLRNDCIEKILNLALKAAEQSIELNESA